MPNVSAEDLASLRRTAKLLLVGEALGGLVGTLLFIGSFGICGKTSLFIPGFLALSLGSICMAATFRVLRRIRRVAAATADRLAAWAWAGFPMVPAVLLELTLILRNRI